MPPPLHLGLFSDSLVLSWSDSLPFSYFVPMFLFSLAPCHFQISHSPSLVLSSLSHSYLYLCPLEKKKKSITENQRRRPWHGQFTDRPPPTLPNNHFTVAFCHRLGCLLHWYIFNAWCVCACVTAKVCATLMCFIHSVFFFLRVSHTDFSRSCLHTKFWHWACVFVLTI